MSSTEPSHLSEYKAGPRSRMRRRTERASYDRAAVHAVLDEGLVAHVGIAEGEQPFVLPMVYVRVGESVYLHGARGSRLLRALSGGKPLCLTVTLLDGLVLARSAFHHSMNFRSVTVYGTPQAVEDEQEKLEVMDALVEHVCAGRTADARPANPAESKATSLIRIDIEEAAVKARSGPPIDDEADYGLDCWAGVIPLQETAGVPVADPRMPADCAVPDYVAPGAIARRHR